MELKNINKFFGNTQVIYDVNFKVQKGDFVTLLGPSGCGKTTILRMIAGFYEPDGGSITLAGRQIEHIPPYERNTAMVFQEYALFPHMTVYENVAYGLHVRHLDESEVKQRVEDALKLMQLKGMGDRYPNQMSGGQQQRVGIARALAVEPEFIVCDEPISALDVSIQSQVVNMLEDLQEKQHLTYLFIAHDISVVRHISDRIGVMYLGQMVELAESYELCSNPMHPYTQSLLSAVPLPDPVKTRAKKRHVLEGDVPSPLHPPKGCRFHTRCPKAMEICSQEAPVWAEYCPGHFAACHHLAQEFAGKTIEDLAAAQASAAAEAGEKAPGISEVTPAPAAGENA
jgi:oligopeptide transport system ATP-binding protein